MQAFAEDEWHDNTLAAGTAGSIDNPNAAGKYFECYAKYAGSSWATYASASDTAPTDYMWLNEVPLTFWCWNGTAAFPAGGAPAYTVGTGVLTFKYAATGDADDDIVFACNTELRKFNDAGEIVSGESSGSRTDDKVDIRFFHALSEVNFIICTSGDDSFDPALVIKDIAIENVYAQGLCSLDGSKCNSTQASSAFAWSSLSNSTSFTQNFGPQTGTGSTWTDKTASGKQYRKTGSSFFIVPQTLGSTAQIRLTFSDNTSRTSSIATQEMKPGYYYTYKLSAHSKTVDFTATLVDWGDGGTYTLTK